jgi:hypothetical protein
VHGTAVQSLIIDLRLLHQLFIPSDVAQIVASLEDHPGTPPFALLVNLSAVQTRQNGFSMDQHFPSLRASHASGRFRALKDFTRLFFPFHVGLRTALSRSSRWQSAA